MTRSVILFDGVCNLCNGFVRFIIERDPQGRVRFASLQSETGAKLLMQHDTHPGKALDSVVLLENGRIYRKSTAVLRLCRSLSGPWPLASLFLLVPRFLRDSIYDSVAKRRYRLFGTTDHCLAPSPELRNRFL